MRPHWLAGGLQRRFARISLVRICFLFLQPTFRTSIYGLSLGKSPKTTRNFSPPILAHWPGDAGRGATILDGDFELAGKAILETDTPWRVSTASARWRAKVAQFDWLSDLHALGTHSARERARRLIIKWIETDGNWNSITWRSSALASRLANWIRHSEFFLVGSDESFRGTFISSLRRQARHLGRIAPFSPLGTERIINLKGLIFTDIALNEGARLEKLGLKLVLEIQKLILPDGFNAELNPSQQLVLLRDLIDIRESYFALQITPPEQLTNAIQEMAPMLRFFRHGDGMLALFNGGVEEEGWLIDVVLERANAAGKPPASAAISGFERLQVNRTLVLMDTGKSTTTGPDRNAHAGALSFELSVGKERLIVNCGAHMGDSKDWRLAQRTTAAHSTVSVENINSAEIIRSGGLGNRPRNTECKRQERDGQIWIDAEHDGYKPTFGLLHRRRLHLNSSGNVLRGEDTVSGRSGLKFTARFHLHPGVRASLVNDGRAVLLRLPAGGGWRFQAQGGAINLQESVYLGAGDRVKRTHQIIVSAATGYGDNPLKWMLSKV